VKELLAKQLLAEVLGLEDLDDIEAIAARLTTLSAVKYDDYGGYSPGVKFIESLAVWLNGFEQDDRRTALDFIFTRLAYVSEVELDHLVSTVYKDLLRPLLVAKAASVLDLPKWAVRQVTDSATFKSLQRRTLILGMSDGARLDKLRRYSALSTEQFHLVSVLDEAKQDNIKDKLAKALKQMKVNGPATFNSVVVVDDFSGSGTTMLRKVDETADVASWDGKLPKLRRHLSDLKTAGVIAEDATVIVLLYLISHKADIVNRSGFDGDSRYLISTRLVAVVWPA
jgi:hypothetical protein